MPTPETGEGMPPLQIGLFYVDWAYSITKKTSEQNISKERIGGTA
jgi:hypothetical protein